MRSKTLRWIVLSAAILTAAIIITQLYWLNTVYSLEQKNFNVNVVKSIRGLYEDIELTNNPVLNLQSMIEHPKADYFTFRADKIPPIDTLKTYIKRELQDFDVLTDCFMAIYDPVKNSYSNSNYISTIASRYEATNPNSLERYKKEYPYILLYFPHRTKYVLAQMKFWFFSSGILILVLIGLAISLFYFYQQKFLAEIQKDFVNNFTHEFKTPLAVMKIATGVLLQNDIHLKPEKLKNYAGILQNQTDHLQGQVERLLKVATSESKDIPLEKKWEEINPLVVMALKQIEPLVEDSKAIIQLHLDELSPTAWVDASHLQLALINIIENAIKYSKEPKIVISTGKENNDTFISIKDNGIGIEKKYLHRIFNKFYRVPTGNVHDVKGFGLGLNFVKRIISAHNGRIIVNSLPGIGTEFRILLPVH